MAEPDFPSAAPGGPGAPAAAIVPDNLAALIAGARSLPAAEIALMPLGTRLSLRLRDTGAIGRVGAAFGLELPAQPSGFSANETRVAVRLGPDEWLLGADADDPAQAVRSIAEALDGVPHALADVTERSLTLVLSGEAAANVLAAGCPLDLSDRAFPVGSGTRTILGKAEIVLCRATAQEYHIDVWRSFAPYVFAFLDEARREKRV